MRVSALQILVALACVGAAGAPAGYAQAVGDSVPMTRVVVPVQPEADRDVEPRAAIGEVHGPIPATQPAGPTTQAASVTSEVPAGGTTVGGGAGVGGGEIRRVRGQGGEAGAGDAAGGSRLGGAAWETIRVILGLGVVLGLIVGMKMGAGKLFGLRSAGVGVNRGVRVLSRTMMGPRQQLVLLQVGRKLVLVSDSGGAVSTVTEVTDPDEVAELAAQALGSGEAAGFAGMFGRQTRVVQARGVEFVDSEEEGEFESLPDERAATVGTESRRGEPDLSGLAERVRLLGRQFSAS